MALLLLPLLVLFEFLPPAAAEGTAIRSDGAPAAESVAIGSTLTEEKMLLLVMYRPQMSSWSAAGGGGRAKSEPHFRAKQQEGRVLCCAFQHTTHLTCRVKGTA